MRAHPWEELEMPDTLPECDGVDPPTNADVTAAPEPDTSYECDALDDLAIQPF